ncbi:trichohyalin-like [Leptopilina heterotoma]|uniref:trichohyalin-like n=1 Tax=Leptopilina heterotoma TaxID=63436 RepID=UPI001CA96DA8|nr:trichohyalin-like [Leptopilina heterotoma]
MAANALEEKINKIRLQNEEIKRRYEEVEADKKNAAKLNALVQMVPSSDWPERKEPPEFTRKETSKTNVKSKPIKEHSERPQQYLIGAVEGKKIHKFAQGDGPPPDPKYNFLADSEREENIIDDKRDEDKQKAPNKYVRNGPRKRGGGRDVYQKDHRKIPATSRDGYLPEYDAWRAERNRIDEARINRQRTAEGNWRREWDNDKVNIKKDSSKKDLRFSLGDTSRRDYKEYDKRHQFEVEPTNRSRGGNHHGSHGPRNHGHYDNQNDFSESLLKGPLSPIEDKTVVATDKSIKVTVNHGNMPIKGPVMSVKVNAPSIAGTGRVGPRQKSRVTYSSHGESEITTHQLDNFYRQKSFDEKTHFNNTQRTNPPKSPFTARRKDNNKSPFLQRKDVKRDEQPMRENSAKSPSAQRKKFKEQQKSPQSHQMHFFTSTSQGIVPSRGRGQKRLNGAKNTVIKILGRTDSNEGSNLNTESENLTDISKFDVKDAEQFSLDVNEAENLKNHCENNDSLTIDNFTIVEAENSNQSNDSIVSRDSEKEEETEGRFPLKEELTPSEEIETKKIVVAEEMKSELKESEEIPEDEKMQNLQENVKEIEVLTKAEDLEKIDKAETSVETKKNKEGEKNEEFSNSPTNEVLEKKKISEDCEVLEENKILKKEEVEKVETLKSDNESIAKEDTVTNEIKTEMEQIKKEDEEIEKITEDKKETETKEMEEIESKETETENIEQEKRKIETEKTEPKESEIEKIEQEKRKMRMEKIEQEKRKMEIEKIEQEKRKIETVDTEIEKMEKIEPVKSEISPNSTKIEEQCKENKEECKKSEEQSKKEEIEQEDQVKNTNEEISEKIPTTEESLPPKNISPQTENCITESNEAKIDHEQMTLKSEINENVKDIIEELLEKKSTETVSTEIPKEASCLPTE